MRAELLPPLSPGGAARRGDRYVDQSPRVSVRDEKSASPVNPACDKVFKFAAFRARHPGDGVARYHQALPGENRRDQVLS